MEIKLTHPDDWHLHLRDDAQMRTVLSDTVCRFARAIVMPNLNPPITTIAQALEYRQRILAALASMSVNIPEEALRAAHDARNRVASDETYHEGRRETSEHTTQQIGHAAANAGILFDPLMTLYLTDNTSAEEIRKARQSGAIHAVKLYPAGATTNSAAGVTDIRKTWPALEEMQRCGMPLLVHGEVTDPDVDIFDREAVFIERVLQPLLKDLPELRLVFEHITTRNAAQFVTSAPDNIAATITAHHLLYNRNAMLAGGIRPHYYCLPVLKREVHREALVAAVSSGNKKFFLGTDSAPHAQHTKETACGCAGIYTAHAAIELYAEVFEEACALGKLEAFASFHGADFYGLPRNTRTITLRKDEWQVPTSVEFGEHRLVPLRAGEMMKWKLVAGAQRHPAHSKT